jgi:hypothetical protein
MTRKLFFAVLLAAVLPGAAFAQTPGSGGPVATAWGPRVGFGFSPDQLMFGAQLELGGIAPDVTIIPNVEIGVGDNVTTLNLSGDVHYHFNVQTSAWRPYIGAGLTFIHASVDAPPGFDGSSTDLGATIIGGAIVPTRSGSRFFTELHLGLGDVHDFKLIAGWNFKM